MVLINRSLLFIPTYYLSTYPIMDYILNSISKLASDFLWSNRGNGSGIHLISQNNTIIGRSKADLGLRNLKFSRTALMSKNSLNFINSKQVSWVEIAKLKYGGFQNWVLTLLANCSWFFRILCKTVDINKPNLCIKVVNPQITSFSMDPMVF